MNHVTTSRNDGMGVRAGANRSKNHGEEVRQSRRYRENSLMLQELVNRAFRNLLVTSNPTERIRCNEYRVAQAGLLFDVSP
jgi:hypothetical protein